MSKICVYTCITGEYDDLKQIKYVDKEYDYYCFTNNKNIKSDFWNVIYINEELDNLTLARKIKILGHEILKKYDITIWLDGALELRKPLSEFIDYCKICDYDMVGFKHNTRDCIYDEINACVACFKENIENAKKIEDFLIKGKYPKKNGLIESTAIVRKNNKNVDKLMNEWYKMLIKYSRRDQLSFNYCLWKNPININMLDLNVFDNEFFVHTGHKRVVFSKKYRIYFGDSKEFDYKKVYDGIYDYKDGYYSVNVTVPCNCDKIEFMVAPYDFVIFNDIKTDIDYSINCWNIDNYKIFARYLNIIFNKKFKKGSEFKLLINISTIDTNDSLNIFSDYVNNSNTNHKKLTTKYENELSNIRNELLSTRNELQKVLNSKGWKLLEKLRKLK